MPANQKCLFNNSFYPPQLIRMCEQSFLTVLQLWPVEEVKDCCRPIKSLHLLIHLLFYINCTPEFVCHTLRLGYRPYLKLSHTNPVNTLPHNRDRISLTQRMWPGDVDTTLSGRSKHTEQRDFSQLNLVLYRLHLSSEPFPLLGCPREQEVDMRSRHQCRESPEPNSKGIMTRKAATMRESY